jgi:hypothetical protein
VSIVEKLEARIRGTRLGESRSAEREGSEDGTLNHPNIVWRTVCSVSIPQIEEASELGWAGGLCSELFIEVWFMPTIDPYSRF